MGVASSVKQHVREGIEMKAKNPYLLPFVMVLTTFALSACASDDSEGETSATCRMACHLYAECSGCEYADAEKAQNSCLSMCGDLYSAFSQEEVDAANICSECVNAEIGDTCDISFLLEEGNACEEQCAAEGAKAFQQQWSELIHAEDDSRYEDFKCQGCSGYSSDMESSVSYSCSEMRESAGKCICKDGPQQGKEFDFVDPCNNEAAENQLIAECE